MAPDGRGASQTTTEVRPGSSSCKSGASSCPPLRPKKGRTASADLARLGALSASACVAPATTVREVLPPSEVEHVRTTGTNDVIFSAARAGIETPGPDHAHRVSGVRPSICPAQVEPADSEVL